MDHEYNVNIRELGMTNINTIIRNYQKKFVEDLE
jgi:hypothetical protein